MKMTNKEKYLKDIGYDCRGILTLMDDPIKFSEWQNKDIKHREDLVYISSTEDEILEFIDTIYNLVIKYYK